jgi:hypothetical protein
VSRLRCRRNVQPEPADAGVAAWWRRGSCRDAECRWRLRPAPLARLVVMAWQDRGASEPHPTTQ